MRSGNAVSSHSGLIPFENLKFYLCVPKKRGIALADCEKEGFD